MNSNCNKSISDTKTEVNKFIKRKLMIPKLSEKYKELSAVYEDDRFSRWSHRVNECGDYLEFYKFEHAGLKLKAANFCCDRLCAMCNWRRSLRTFAKISKIIQSKQFVECKYKNLFLTLTIKNVEIDKLHESFKHIFYSFDKFLKNKRIKETIKGYFRALEITYNKKERTFHPHLHLILAVGNSYFKNDYISQADLTDIWQKSLAVDYTPVVDIRRFRDSKGVAEASKYVVKADNKFLKSITNKALYTLRLELQNVRLLGSGGIYRQIAKQLKLELNNDIVEIDLPQDDILIEILKYRWVVGMKNYELFEKEKVGF